MDRERLFRHLEQRYTSKREMISRIPLGTQADALWQELLSRRRAKSTVLPVYSCFGMPYWYVTTDKMVDASEKIVETLLENETEFDPYTDAPPVSTLEEVFFTSFVDGSRMTMQEAMSFLQSESPPRDVEEQLIVNNRQAGGYATANLYRAVDEEYLGSLAAILTDGLEAGAGSYREEDWIMIPSMPNEQYTLPQARTIPDRVRELLSLLEDPRIHPLIKSAVAQAWMMVIRPFPEGNERLGRMLSMIILLRSGYSFFSEVSLSSLIARKSYGYYEAIGNILREENGGDLTYFLEYYLELLSRAVDERKLRISQKQEQNRMAEADLARTPLSSPSVDTELVPPDDDDSPPDQDETETDSDPSKEDAALQEVREKLIRFANENRTTIMGRTAGKMVDYLDNGKYTFTTGDLEDDFGVSQKPRSLLATMLKDAHIVDLIGTKGRFFVYRFCGLGEGSAVPGMKNRDVAPKLAKEKKPPKQVKKAGLIKPDRSSDLAFPDADVLTQASTAEQRQRVKKALMEYSRNNGNSVYTRTAARIAGYVDAGKFRFCSEDFTHDFGIDRKKRVMIATKLQRLGFIVPVGMDGRFYVYGFRSSPGQAVDDPVLEEEAISTGFDSYEEEQELDLNGFFDRNPAALMQKEHPMEVQSAS